MAILYIPDGPNITYWESTDGSLSESYVNDQIRCSRLFRTAWNDRWRFVRSMVGWSEFSDEPSLTTTYIKRFTPSAYPIKTHPNSKPFLWAKNVNRIRGDGILQGGEAWSVADQVGVYQFAHLDLQYETLPYGVLSDAQMRSLGSGSSADKVDESNLGRYVLKIVQPASEYLTFPRGAYKWVTAPVAAVDNSNGRVISFLDVTYVWHQIPGVPTALYETVGCVNDAEFDSSPTETLLLVGANLKPYRDVCGKRVFDIEMKMRFFNPSSGIGHNHFLRFVGDSVAPYYDRMTSDGTSGGDPVFAKKDFTKLFMSPFAILMKDF